MRVITSTSAFGSHLRSSCHTIWPFAGQEARHGRTYSFIKFQVIVVTLFYKGESYLCCWCSWVLFSYRCWPSAGISTLPIESPDLAQCGYLLELNIRLLQISRRTVSLTKHFPKDDMIAELGAFKSSDWIGVRKTGSRLKASAIMQYCWGSRVQKRWLSITILETWRQIAYILSMTLKLHSRVRFRV